MVCTSLPPHTHICPLTDFGDTDDLLPPILHNSGGISGAGTSAGTGGTSTSGDDGRCEALYNEINRLVGELKRRSAEYAIDPRGLPETGPMSRAGHRQQYSNKQTRLQNKLKEAMLKSCTAFRSDAWSWATRPI